MSLAQEEKQQQQPIAQQGQSLQQLQILLKDTIKENKTLQNKNNKLQTKYVQLFKQQKSLKKDHTLFLAFLTKYFASQTSDSSISPFQETPIGQFQMQDLQRMAQLKQTAFKTRISELQQKLQQIEKKHKASLQSSIKEKQQLVSKQYEQQIQLLKINAENELNASIKQIDSLKKSNNQQSDEIQQLKSTLQAKHNQLSKTIKDKLKLQHQLNSMRKREIAQQLHIIPEQQNQRVMNERNEFLSLRQQVQDLMIKRDQNKRSLKQKEEQLSTQRAKNQQLQQEIRLLRQKQAEMDEKAQLVRQCTVEELQNLIFSPQDPFPNDKPDKEGKMNVQNEDNQEIRHEYLKNILVRYIKAETSGSFDQALMLLEIVGTLLKLDPDSSRALESYKQKRRQWWFIKY